MRRHSFAFRRKSSFGGPAKIVSGADGDLVITNGQTVDIAPGSVKQYNSIDIQAGGTLRITGSGLTKTEIGCRNSFTLNGTIVCKCSLGAVSSASVSGNTTIGNKAYSFTLNQAPGGSGGTGGNASGSDNGDPPNAVYAGGAGGGAQGNGYGGGGGGGGAWGTAFGYAAGGGAGSSSGGGGGGGGYTSWTDKENNSFYASGGPGGAGSSGKGEHGSFLFLYLEDTISGTGSVNMNGYNATSNGNGGSNGGGSSGNSGGGGGGGGAAGGSGGSVLIYKPSAQTFTPSISYSAGAGSAGGGGGAPFSSGFYGGGGAAGSSGYVGSSSINNW